MMMELARYVHGISLKQATKSRFELNPRGVRYGGNVCLLRALYRIGPGRGAIHQLLDLAEVLQQVPTLMHLFLRNRRVGGGGWDGSRTTGRHGVCDIGVPFRSVKVCICVLLVRCGEREEPTRPSR